MNKYVSPKAEWIALSLQNVIMTSETVEDCSLDLNGPGLDDGTMTTTTGTTPV